MSKMYYIRRKWFCPLVSICLLISVIVFFTFSAFENPEYPDIGSRGQDKSYFSLILQTADRLAEALINRYNDTPNYSVRSGFLRIYTSGINIAGHTPSVLKIQENNIISSSFNRNTILLNLRI